MKEFNIRMNLYSKLKFIGLGLMINNEVPVTIEKHRFVIELRFFFINFWLEIYTKSN